MIRREGGRVLIDISEGEYEELMMALGYAAGALLRERGSAKGVLRLADAINEGNPDYTPRRWLRYRLAATDALGDFNPLRRLRDDILPTDIDVEER